MTQELTVVSKQEMFAPTKEDYQEMSVGEPKNMLEVRALANFLSRSKFIPQSFRGDLNTAVMLIVTCKQYGLPITALSEVMEVNGKVGFWGRTKLGIVLKSGVCEYIIPTEQTDKKCTLETQRKGWPKPVSITYTLDQAEKAGLLARSDAWKKHPSDMLYWRAVSRIISQVYPDVIQGFATVEEEEENPMPKAQVVAMPQEIEMPKPKRARKVKAIDISEADLQDEEKGPMITDIHQVRKIQNKAIKEMQKEYIQSCEEENSESPIFPTTEELENFNEENHQEAIVEEVKTEVFERPVKNDTPKRYVRFVKQVLLENGERYVIAKNPLVDREDKWKIPTAGMASELKKLTGLKAYIFVANDTVYNYEEYAD